MREASDFSQPSILRPKAKPTFIVSSSLANKEKPGCVTASLLERLLIESEACTSHFGENPGGNSGVSDLESFLIALLIRGSNPNGSLSSEGIFGLMGVTFGIEEGTSC